MDFNFNDNIILENESVRLEPLTRSHHAELLPIALTHPTLLQYSPKFKYKNFRDHLIKYQNEKPNIQCLKLDTAFEKWKGDLEQVDDICVIGVRV